MIRTDLALEAKEMYHENAGKITEIEGVRANTEDKGGLCVTTVEILNEAGKKALGKEIGTYVTIEMPDFNQCGPCFYEAGSMELKKQLKKLLHLTEKDEVLVVGLGNRSITPDALGSYVIDKLIVTKHLHILAPQAVENFGSVCGIAPGVLGSTGMETAEIIHGLLTKIHPAAVLVIDALAARSSERIGTTIQLSDTGIRPGSGIGNVRSALDKDSLGIPVIAIGVPMVVDAATLAFDAVTKAAGKQTHFENLKNELFKKRTDMVVTPKDIDKLLKHMSDIVSAGINLALHNISLNEIAYYIG